MKMFEKYLQICICAPHNCTIDASMLCLGGGHKITKLPLKHFCPPFRKMLLQSFISAGFNYRIRVALLTMLQFSFHCLFFISELP